MIEGYLDEPAFSAFYEYLRPSMRLTTSHMERSYLPEELLNASLLTLWITASFEPTGEESGTEYAYPCRECMAGRTVRGYLVLNLTKVPRGKDIAQTIARDEWVISDRLAAIIEDNHISGVELRPVNHYASRAPRTKWHQMVITSTVRVSDRTAYGTPYRNTGRKEDTITPCGHAVKDIVYSELFVEGNIWDESDMVRTDLYFGGHLNLIHPYPHILISQKFYRLLKENGVKGYKIEVAHMV